VRLQKNFRGKRKETKLLDDLQQVDFCVQLNLGFFEQFVFSGQFSATAALEAGFGQPVLLPSVVETGSFV
jgi:hypothetical protein